MDQADAAREKRAAKRWRTHLRSVRLFDEAQRFLVECRVVDMSITGARLKPENDRPLPLQLRYCDDNMEFFESATLVWVRKGDIGIRFEDTPPTDG